MIINKTMDRRDLESPRAKIIIKELNDLIRELKLKGLKISSWYGTFQLSNNLFERINRGYDYEPLEGAVDDINFPWFLYWEITWLVLNNDYKGGQKVLDIGGCSSLMSYYLASKGLSVIAIDLQDNLVENGNKVAEKMNWALKNYLMDAREININEEFDHIVSVCVYEHIPMFDRIQINQKIKNLLKQGGTFSITIDFRNPSKFANINSSQAVKDQFIIPSGLQVVENVDFVDNKLNYLLHPFFHKSMNYKIKKSCIKKKEFNITQFFSIKRKNDYTFGALFLRNNI